MQRHPHRTASRLPSAPGEKEAGADPWLAGAGIATAAPRLPDQDGRAPGPLPLGERVDAQRPGEGRVRQRPAAHTRPLARTLRRHQTEAETLLWTALRDRRLAGYRFSRQVRIGSFIADFCCRGHRLVVELDGGQHLDDPGDASRTSWLNVHGYGVLRFWNNDVVSRRADVLDTILAALEKRLTPSPGLRYAPADLSPAGRG